VKAPGLSFGTHGHIGTHDVFYAFACNPLILGG
jgi:hypothetical protein